MELLKQINHEKKESRQDFSRWPDAAGTHEPNIMNKIAIHNSDSGFSHAWVDHCIQNGIPFKLVNCFDNDIIPQISDCQLLMWHHHHNGSKDLLMAKQLLFAVSASGKRVFPDFNTGWHFNDKLGQKYLLEATGLPHVPTYVFYNKQQALKWLNQQEYPIVFKLRNGAGAMNVRLAGSFREAARFTQRMFARGIPAYSQTAVFKDKLRLLRQGKASLTTVCKAAAKWVIPLKRGIMQARERGYAYFQEFIPNNRYDIRVIVVHDKAIAIQRFVRSGDFRASGSGKIIALDENTPRAVLNLAFRAREKLRSTCLALDFVFDEQKPLITEISYAFTPQAYQICQGYWDDNLRWHRAPVELCAWMIESMLSDEKA